MHSLVKRQFLLGQSSKTGRERLLGTNHGHWRQKFFFQARKRDTRTEWFSGQWTLCLSFPDFRLALAWMDKKDQSYPKPKAQPIWGAAINLVTFWCRNLFSCHEVLNCCKKSAPVALAFCNCWCEATLLSSLVWIKSAPNSLQGQELCKSVVSSVHQGTRTTQNFCRHNTLNSPSGESSDTKHTSAAGSQKSTDAWDQNDNVDQPHCRLISQSYNYKFWFSFCRLRVAVTRKYFCCTSLEFSTSTKKHLSLNPRNVSDKGRRSSQADFRHVQIQCYIYRA